MTGSGEMYYFYPRKINVLGYYSADKRRYIGAAFESGELYLEFTNQVYLDRPVAFTVTAEIAIQLRELLNQLTACRIIPRRIDCVPYPDITAEECSS